MVFLSERNGKRTKLEHGCRDAGNLRGSFTSVSQGGTLDIPVERAIKGESRLFFLAERRPEISLKRFWKATFVTPREPTVVRVGRSTVSSEQRSYMPTTTLNFRKRTGELTLLPRTVHRQARESIRISLDTFYDYIMCAIRNVLKFCYHCYDTRLSRLCYESWKICTAESIATYSYLSTNSLFSRFFNPIFNPIIL